MEQRLGTNAPASNSAPRKSILAFFLVAGALYTPVALFAGVQVAPNVSLFNLATFIPATAALILVFLENKLAGVRDLLKRTFDFPRIKSKVWYIPIFLLYPGIALVQYGIALVLGSQVPSPTGLDWRSL